jgi:hypothetical protein
MTIIRNCQIILGTGEDILANPQKMNLFIGENSPAAIDALAEACCGAHNINFKTRCVNFEFDYGDKTYVVTTVSSKDGTTALVKYPEDTDDYNETAFFEFASIRDEFSYNNRNVFKNDKICKMDDLLSDSEISMLNYKEFINGLKNRGDDRPIFISGFFEKIDKETRDRILNELSTLTPNSQIFIAVIRDVFGDEFEGEKIFLEKIWDVV